MTRSLCTLALSALFSLSINAGTVEFAQWVPWKFVSQELKKSELSFQRVEDSLELSAGELKPVVKNLVLSVKGQVNQFGFSSGAISLDAEGVLDIQLGKIIVDQMITRVFGGNVITVKVQAVCTSAALRIPTLTVLSRFAVNEDGDFLPRLNGLDFSIPADSWEIIPPQCDGLSGIGAEIESTLKEALLNPSSLTPYIRNWVAPMLNDWIRSQWLKVSSSQGEWSDLAITTADENGFLMKGDLVVAMADDVVLSDIPAALMGDTPKFILSREGFRTIIQDRVAKLLPKQYDLRENDSFRKLLSSRLMQFFAWPDLRRFNSNTPFVIKNDPTSYVLGLTEVKGKWSAKLSGNGKLITLIGGAPIDYIVYKLGVTVPLAMNLSGGNLAFSTGTAASTISWSFGALYDMLYHPEKKIPVNVLTGALSDLASNKKEIVELPRFTVGDHDYILNNLQTTDQLITMDWL